MTPRIKLAATLVLLLVLGGLGTADYYFAGRQLHADLGGASSDGQVESTPSSIPLPPEGAVMKGSGPVVADVAAEHQLSTAQSTIDSLLAQVVTDGTPLESLALLHQGDRAGSVTWVESATVKTHFSTLKDALLASFSPQMHSLSDQTLQVAGKPIRNVLSFTDPAISEESIVFVRVRERLYEFHLTPGKEETMNQFIDDVTSL